MRRWLAGMAVFGVAALSVTVAASQPPPGRGGDNQPPGGGRGGRGGPGGPPPFQLGRVLPPFARDELNLTKEQEADIAKLEMEVKERLSKILTDDQKKKLETLRPPGRGGPGGPGGPGGDGPGGGPGGRGGPPPGGPSGAPGPLTQERAPANATGATLPAGIQWFATLEGGLREAKRTGRPILLVSAAPHCAGVPGIW